MRVAQYLKPAWAGRLLELALPRLPAGTSLALWLGGKRILAEGARGETLGEDAADVLARFLQLDGRRVGILLLAPPPGAETAAADWAEAFVFSLQGVLDAEHARRQVGKETLESYREMALLQRAVHELNRSLKPAAVARALLKEFEDEKNGGADFGAVFLREADGDTLDPIACFGADAVAEFARLEESLLFPAMAESSGGDIIDDLLALPAWQGRATAFHALLWLPLVAHDQKLGLLVLAARRNAAFSAADMKRAQALCAVAATALRNAQLYAAEQEMFHSFVHVIATAIDAKSPYTAGHCRRVPEIALMLADAAHRADGPFADFALDEEERKALWIGAMLHDCGKVVTPEWIVDKATKLDAIVNRFELIALRFETLRRDAAIESLRAVADGMDPAAAEAARQERLARLDADLAFLERMNRGSEFVSEQHAERIRAIAGERWRDGQGTERPLLAEEEIYNLLTPRGTLNPRERKIIEDHAVHTLNMLSQIPFPRSLRNVPEYAGCHHERMDGSGYPRGLTGDELSIPARIVAIADIFEALTAADRPYRQPTTLSWAVDIMRRMKQDGHIDGDLFDLFLAENIPLAYAAEHLRPEQIDL